MIKLSTLCSIWFKAWPKLLVMLAGVGLFSVAVCWLGGVGVISVPLIFIFLRGVARPFEKAVEPLCV